MALSKTPNQSADLVSRMKKTDVFDDLLKPSSSDIRWQSSFAQRSPRGGCLISRTQNQGPKQGLKTINRLMAFLFCGFFPRSAGIKSFMFCTCTHNQINRAGFPFHVLSISSIRLHSFLFRFIACPRPARPDKVLICRCPVSVKNFETVSFRSAEVCFHGSRAARSSEATGSLCWRRWRRTAARCSTPRRRCRGGRRSPEISAARGHPIPRSGGADLVLKMGTSSFRFEGCVSLGVFQHTFVMRCMDLGKVPAANAS